MTPTGSTPRVSKHGLPGGDGDTASFVQQLHHSVSLGCSSSGHDQDGHVSFSSQVLYHSWFDDQLLSCLCGVVSASRERLSETTKPHVSVRRGRSLCRGAFVPPVSSEVFQSCHGSVGLAGSYNSSPGKPKGVSPHCRITSK
jgi:hypothetical protein